MLKHFSIKSQILILQVLTNAIVIVIVVVFIFSWEQQVVQQKREISEKILINQQIESHIKTIQSLLRARLLQLQQNSQLALQNVQRLYQFHEQFRVQFTQENKECEDSEIFDIFCYGIQGSDNMSYDDLQQLTSIAHQTMLMMPVEKLYFTSTGADQFFAIWPQYGLWNYKPHSRPWYQYQMKNPETDFLLGQPYVTYGGGILVTQTATIKLADGRLRAVIGQDIDVNQVDFQLSQINASLIDQKGRLIISQYYEKYSMELKYIHNKEQTGINYEDFQNILQLANNSLTERNNCERRYENTYCITEHERTILVRTITVGEFILLFQIDQQIFFSQIQQLVAEISEQESLMLNYLFIYSFCYCGLNIITYALTFCMISRPLNELMKMVRPTKTLLESLAQDQIRSQGNQGNSIGKLKKTLMRLFVVDGRTNQNSTKLKMETILYPVKDLTKLEVHRIQVAKIRGKPKSLFNLDLNSIIRKAKLPQYRFL